MNTYSICLCILLTIIATPSNATLSDLFGGGQDSGPPPQVRQIQQLGQLAQQLQQFAPNPAQLLGQIGQYGPQLLELANQAQKLLSEDDNDSPQQQNPIFQQGQGQGLGQGQGQGQRYGQPIRQQPLKQIQFQQQQQQQRNQLSQGPPINFNRFGPQSLDGETFYGPELDSPPEVVHVHRHIIEHRGPSGYGGDLSSSGLGGGQNGQNVRIIKIIHEQAGNSLGSGYAYGRGYGQGYDYRQ